MKVRFLFLTLSVYDDDDLKRLSRGERYIWDVSWLDTEWENGGLSQVFFNDTGNRIAETIEALEAIGAPKSAHVLREACRLFPDGQPARDQETRRAQIYEIWDRTPDAFEKIEGPYFQEDENRRLLEYWFADPESQQADAEPLRRKRTAHRLFVELPIDEGGDLTRLKPHEVWLRDICYFAAMAGGKGGIRSYLFSFEQSRAPDLLKSLEAIGAGRTSNLIRLACDSLAELPSDEFGLGPERIKVIERLTEIVYSTIEIVDGVVKGQDWHEDLFDLLLKSFPGIVARK